MSILTHLPKMVVIPGGEFLMGSADKSDWLDMQPQHLVNIQSFMMGIYPITQAEWREVASLPKIFHPLTPEPSTFNFMGDTRPVEGVSWYEAMEFCHRLSVATEAYYRLPTEAEWEYACRAGTITPYYFGDEITQDQANYLSQSTTPVGQYPPNAFGLYDMHGNVWEWCLDDWHKNYEGAPTDGSSWPNTKISKWERRAVNRGGSFLSSEAICGSGIRASDVPAHKEFDIGFRVVCEV